MIVILMGVSGSGKTEVGRMLASAVGWPFHEGDDHHPPANVAKMSRGVPLTDEDRRPWLRSLRDLIDSLEAAGESAVLSCSALKESYRRVLNRDGADELVRFVYLKGDRSLLEERLEGRTDHFMKVDLLGSQLDTLEEPESERAVTVVIDRAPGEIAREIRERLCI